MQLDATQSTETRGVALGSLSCGPFRHTRVIASPYGAAKGAIHL